MRRVAVLITSAFLLIPAAAQAGPRHGQATDPPYDTERPVLGQNNDLAGFQVFYFPRAGIVQGTTTEYLRFNPDWDEFNGAWFNFYATLGKRRHGVCVTTSGLRTHYYTPDDEPNPPRPPDATLPDGTRLNGSYAVTFSADRRTDVYTYTDARLKRRDYDCVTGIRLSPNGLSGDDTMPDLRLR
jgi:hypothetical protein